MILWCSLLLQKIECTDQHFMCLGICLIPKFVLQINCLKAWYIHLFQALQINICVRWMRGLMGALAAMEVLMLKHGRMLPPYIECEFKRAYNVYRSALNSLADRAIGRREARYHIRPKLHFLGHLVYHYLPRNPRHFMNYADEDFVARTKKLAERSHPSHQSRLTLLRYTLHVCLRYSGKIAVWAWPDRWWMEKEWSAVIFNQSCVHSIDTIFIIIRMLTIFLRFIVFSMAQVSQRMHVQRA